MITINIEEFLEKQNRDFKDCMQLINTGVCNEIIDAYCWEAMDRADIDDKKKIEVIQKLHKVYDEYTAEEALESYRK